MIISIGVRNDHARTRIAISVTMKRFQLYEYKYNIPILLRKNPQMPTSGQKNPKEQGRF